jgi:hypothetical protein
MVRDATFGDLAAICALMEEMHTSGAYAKYPLQIERKFKPLVMDLIRSGKGCAFVSTTRDEVTGFLLGMADSLCHVFDVKFATDVFFLPPESDVDTHELLYAFQKWAKAIDGVALIRMTAPTTNGQRDRLGAAYRMVGLSPDAGIFSMEV